MLCAVPTSSLTSASVDILYRPLIAAARRLPAEERVSLCVSTLAHVVEAEASLMVTEDGTAHCVSGLNDYEVREVIAAAVHGELSATMGSLMLPRRSIAFGAIKVAGQGGPSGTIVLASEDYERFCAEFAHAAQSLRRLGEAMFEYPLRECC